MLELITKKEACDHLLLDYEADSSGDYLTSVYDGWLETWIPIVSEAVSGWLKDDWRLYVWEVDSSGEVLIESSGDPVPAEPLTTSPRVRGACLIELASVYRFREGEGKDNVVTPDAGWGYALNKSSIALLSALRKSTIA